MDLTTTYLGLTLKNPLVCGASPLGTGLDTLRHLEESGISAVVLPSLFEEEILRPAQEVHDMLLFSYQEGGIGGIELIEARLRIRN